MIEIQFVVNLYHSMDFYKGNSFYIVCFFFVFFCVLSTMTFVYVQEHAQMLTLYCLLCHLCSLFTSVPCLLWFNYYL